MTNQEYINLAHRINEWTTTGDVKNLSNIAFEAITTIRDLTMSVEIAQGQLESCKSDIMRKSKNMMTLAKVPSTPMF